VNIQKILRYAYTVLENPAALADTDHHLLGHTENMAEDDILWNKLIHCQKLRQEALDFEADTNIVFLNSRSLKYEAAVIKLFDGDGLQYGNLIVTACNRPFLARDFENMRLISENLWEQ